jgi:hypothetical protein
VIRAQFEDKSKAKLYTEDEYGGADGGDEAFYDIGNCAGEYPSDFTEVKGEEA